MKYIKLFLMLFGAVSLVLVLVFAWVVWAFNPFHEPNWSEAEMLGDNDYHLIAQNGDLVFQTSKSSPNLPIQKATDSRYSHVGIVFNQGDTALFVFEAVQPVKLTPLEEWIDRGVDADFSALRLRHEQLSDRQIRDMIEMGQRWVGTDYDRNFEWDNNLMYCSELVWKLYSEAAGIQLCEPRQVKDLDLDHPDVRSFIQTRFGGIDQIPEESLIVTPADLYNFDQLMVAW